MRDGGNVNRAKNSIVPQLVQTVHSRMCERLSWIREPVQAWRWFSSDPTRIQQQPTWLQALRTACHDAPGLVLDFDATPQGQRSAFMPRWLQSRSPNMAWVCLDATFAAHPTPLLQSIQAHIQPGGMLFFAAFGPGSLLALQDLYALKEWGPALTAWPDLPDWGQALMRLGFVDPVLDVERIAVDYRDYPLQATAPADVTRSQQILRDLHALRALERNQHPERFAGLRGPAWLAQLRQGLDACTTLEWEIIYGHARLPAAHTGQQTAEKSSSSVKYAYFSLEHIRQKLPKNNK